MVLYFKVVFAFALLASASAGAGVPGAGDGGASAEATEKARLKIASGMAEGLQNNVELRKMLIGKQLVDKDFNGAMGQYRHIIRIQEANLAAGEATAEDVATAHQEAEDNLELLLEHEEQEYGQFLKDPEEMQKGLDEEHQKMLFNNLKIKEILAKQLIDADNTAQARQVYADIAASTLIRYGDGHAKHIAAAKRASGGKIEQQSEGARGGEL